MCAISSFIDAGSDYQNLKLDKKSSYLIIFACKCGRYRYVRLLFGASLVGGMFQHKKDKIFKELPNIFGSAGDNSIVDYVLPLQLCPQGWHVNRPQAISGPYLGRTWQSCHKDYSGSCYVYTSTRYEVYTSLAYNSIYLAGYQCTSIMRIKMKKLQIRMLAPVQSKCAQTFQNT